jgi:4-hydroxymandelate oxidase
VTSDADRGWAALEPAELEAAARQVLPEAVYHWYAAGAGDEATLADNLAAWSRLRLRPRVLRDVASVSTATTVLGTEVATPILVAPTAYHRLAHPDGEAATAAGAAAAGCGMVVSTRASTPLETIAAAAPGGLRWFQVYMLRDRGWTAELVARAAAAGYRALVLTGDTPYLGRKRRSTAHPLVMPPGAGMANIAATVPHAHRAHPEAWSGAEQDPATDLDAIAWLGERSGLPVLVKGVVRGDDAVVCLEAGAAGVVVSNHGGRQLDGVVASAEVVAEVVGAVGGRGEVLVDGGVRRGTDVVKALALGARGVLVGRPVLWGLAVGGVAGVRGVLEGLGVELGLAMGLCGAAGVADLTPDLVT